MNIANTIPTDVIDALGSIINPLIEEKSAEEQTSSRFQAAWGVVSTGSRKTVRAAGNKAKQVASAVASGTRRITGSATFAWAMSIALIAFLVMAGFLIGYGVGVLITVVSMLFYSISPVLGYFVYYFLLIGWFVGLFSLVMTMAGA